MVMKKIRSAPVSKTVKFSFDPVRPDSMVVWSTYFDPAMMIASLFIGAVAIDSTSPPRASSTAFSMLPSAIWPADFWTLP